MSDWLSRLMVERGIIEEDDRDIYRFGIHNGFIILLNLFTALLIGLFTTRLLVVVVFTLSFMTLRNYTGGYHSDSSVFCYISSTLVLFIPIYTLYAFEHAPAALRGTLLIFSIIVILILSPMDSKKRKLDADEIRHYGRRARVLLILQLVVLFILYALGKMELAYAVYSSICLIAVFMLIGKAILQIQQYQDEIE